MIGAVIAWLQQAEAAQWAVAIGDSVWLPIVVAVVLAAGGPLVFLPSQSLVLVATVIVMAHGPDVLALAVLAAAVWAGGMAGDTLTFGIARRGRLVGAVFDRASRLARLRDWVEQQLSRRPWSTVTLARMVPLGRFATAIACADTPLDLVSFLHLAAAAGAVWTLFTMGIGSVAGIWAREHTLLMIVLGVLAGLVTGWIGSLVQRRLVRG